MEHLCKKNTGYYTLEYLHNQDVGYGNTNELLNKHPRFILQLSVCMCKNNKETHSLLECSHRHEGMYSVRCIINTGIDLIKLANLPGTKRVFTIICIKSLHWIVILVTSPIVMNETLEVRLPRRGWSGSCSFSSRVKLNPFAISNSPRESVGRNICVWVLFATFRSHWSLTASVTEHLHITCSDKHTKV